MDGWGGVAVGNETRVNGVRSEMGGQRTGQLFVRVRVEQSGDQRVNPAVGGGGLGQRGNPVTVVIVGTYVRRMQRRRAQG